MPQRPRFVNGEFYHVFNRGVEKRRIFMDEKDHFRFIHDLFEFNDANLVINSGFWHRTGFHGMVPRAERKPRKLLVDIVAYALMPNHYHLLLRQRCNGGISRFLQKLAGGYTQYFNAKYKRSGVLFQGKYKIKHIHRDKYLRHLITYLHLNPVDIFQNNWRKDGIRNVKGALGFLESYRWSSYLDYLNIKNFPSLLELDQRRELNLPGPKEYREQIRGWLEGDRNAPLEGESLFF